MFFNFFKPLRTLRLCGEVNLMKKIRRKNGFTLIEVLLSVALLALVAAVIGVPYMVGLQSLDAEEDRLLLDSHLRSTMEVLVSTDFSLLADGSQAVTVNGTNYTFTWKVVYVDLDGDTVLESDAVQVTITVDEAPNVSLTTIIVDDNGRTGKIS